MHNYVSIDKRSKKEQKKIASMDRVMNGFNTGCREMRTEKYKSRARQKAEDRRAFKEL